MTTLTAQEASKSLGQWLRRAVNGEQIAINEGDCAVMLQPLPPQEAVAPGASAPREALRKLQDQNRLTSTQADDYLHEVREARLTDGRRDGE